MSNFPQTVSLMTLPPYTTYLVRQNKLIKTMYGDRHVLSVVDVNTPSADDIEVWANRKLENATVGSRFTTQAISEFVPKGQCDVIRFMPVKVC